METQNNGRILAAELVGTTVLMLGGPGVAITSNYNVGLTALGFGLALVVLAYVIGPISGCHVNPAVTLGMLIARKVNGVQATFAWLGQLFGGVFGAAIIYGIRSGRKFPRLQFDANLWSGKFYGLGATIVVEVVLTAVLVMVALFATGPKFAPGMGGLVTGLALALGYLIAIPVDNGGLNPARSLGTALFADKHLATSSNWAALQQLWAFIVFPLVGAVVGVILWLILDDSRLEDTMLAEIPGMTEVRDTLDKVADEAVEAVQDTVD
jgi:aquaporin Z